MSLIYLAVATGKCLVFKELILSLGDTHSLLCLSCLNWLDSLQTFMLCDWRMRDLCFLFPFPLYCFIAICIRKKKVTRYMMGSHAEEEKVKIDISWRGMQGTRQTGWQTNSMCYLSPIYLKKHIPSVLVWCKSWRFYSGNIANMSHFCVQLRDDGLHESVSWMSPYFQDKIFPLYCKGRLNHP